MEVDKQTLQALEEFIQISKTDKKAEVECKLLSGKIQTKDIADRILKTISTLSVGTVEEEHRYSISFSDSTRVIVYEPQNIHKLCLTNSFREVPLIVEKKVRYFDGSLGKKDLIDVPEWNLRFTLRSESEIRKDFEGNPSDTKAHIRIINRKSFKTANELFRIDFSMIKSRESGSKKTLRDILQYPATYELEIEFTNKASKMENSKIAEEYIKIVSTLSSAFYQSPFLLKVSDIQRYQQEFRLSKNTFFNPVTMVRRHLNPANTHNISKGYTVTVKADGDRAGLYVANDRRVLRINKNNQITWTGITALDDSHSGDFIDGEYIEAKQLFCIFDIYRFRKRDVRSLPLMKTDDDVNANPLDSRLGCGKLFIEDIRTQFSSVVPVRIESKVFLAGDGPAMEEAIQTLLKTQFEYETDGLIFTPRQSGVAPPSDRKGQTWLRVYKWKPANLNSIDFLVRISNDETFDLITKRKVRPGMLYVSRTSDDDIVYPRETITGEYVPIALPADLQKLTETNTRIPSVFQPIAPRNPDAYKILIPLNDKNITVDQHGNRIDDNTIIECAFDIETQLWTVLRTRYDKTFLYRVMREPQFGNDIGTANSIWTSMHVPITENMISNFITTTLDDTYEDDMYYRDDLKRCSRTFNEVYDFHNRIKDELYKTNINKGDTLLELAVGRAGDLYKWKRVQPSKVVGLDISLSNITSPTQGSAIRYLTDKKNNPQDFLPPVLFVQGDMTSYPLFEQEDKYMPILAGKEKGQTKYLEQFEGLSGFDVVSCQFAIHYACESEEIFRNFAKNLDKYGNGIFMGTCLDGQAVYSLLIGKKTHMFGGSSVCGEYTKEYLDKDSWVEEFGMPIRVSMESFTKPELEYLVPFTKVTEILAENHYELVDSKTFKEVYDQQSTVSLTSEQQTFSFLNRTFVFKRTTKKAEPKVEEPVETALPEKEPEVKQKKVRKLKTGGNPEPEPLLFYGAGEDKGDYRNFSNMSDHKLQIDGVEYPTVEHYFQAEKAKKFEPQEKREVYEKILKAKSAKAAKALGKKVANFNEDTWKEMREGIMELGVRTKFIQHPELRKQLMETGEKIIGEANARDKFWGIGSSVESDKSKVPSKWAGQNMMGKILMKLRDSFNKMDSDSNKTE
jgi:hypothetical protein